MWFGESGRLIGALSGGLLDILYPPRCAGCEGVMRASEQPLCARCVASLERVDQAELDGALDTDTHQEIASNFALWMFDKGGILQRAQHLLKYGRRPGFGRSLGHVLGRAWQSERSVVPELIVPVPLHPARLYERGYNQSAMLAAGVAEAIRVPLLLDGVRRTAATRRQTGLSREERSANVQGAFAIETASVEGRRVLLIDDVVTTGATSLAAARALLAARAVCVDFAALAFARH